MVNVVCFYSQVQQWYGRKMTKWSLQYQEQSTTWYYSGVITAFIPCLDVNFPKAFEWSERKKGTILQGFPY